MGKIKIVVARLLVTNIIPINTNCKIMGIPMSKIKSCQCLSRNSLYMLLELGCINNIPSAGTNAGNLQPILLPSARLYKTACCLLLCCRFRFHLSEFSKIFFHINTVLLTSLKSSPLSFLLPIHLSAYLNNEPFA